MDLPGTRMHCRSKTAAMSTEVLQHQASMGCYLTLDARVCSFFSFRDGRCLHIGHAMQGRQAGSRRDWCFRYLRKYELHTACMCVCMIRDEMLMGRRLSSVLGTLRGIMKSHSTSDSALRIDLLVSCGHAT